DRCRDRVRAARAVQAGRGHLAPAGAFRRDHRHAGPRTRPAHPRTAGSLRMSAQLERVIEALLFLSPEPVGADALAEATGADLHEVTTAIERLREQFEFDRRGLVVRELAGGYALATHPDAESAARRLLARPRTPPLTAAQVETLAI